MAKQSKRQPARTSTARAKRITTQPPPRERKVLVFSMLLGVLTLTSALLLALAPAPLTPDAANSLFAADDVDWPGVLFQTDHPIAGGRWQYIYIHQSKTPDGSAATLGTATGGMADHFLIGNGQGGTSDGQIQIGQRWINQRAAENPEGASVDRRLWPACVSVCVVGDFEHGLPTSLQMRRLEKLIDALQERFHVPADHVILVTDPAASDTPAGIGRYFPAAAFRSQVATQL